MKAPSIASILPVPPEPNPLMRKPLTFRTPDEILAMTFTPGNSYIGEKIVAPGQSTILVGMGGIGKTRLYMQAAAAQITARPFLAFPTRGEGTRWMILQAENNNERLRYDLAHLRRWVGEDHHAELNKRLLIHTLEHDADCLLSLDDPEFWIDAEDAIAAFDPHVLVFDPLGEFSAGDLNRDQDMRALCKAITRLSRKGNPERAIILVHHSLAGKAGVMKATGYERTAFARNSKVLHSWTRAQINVAPGSSDDNNLLVVSCGKCSNGREFAPFAVRLNPDTMIYEVCPEFDWEAWRQEISGKTRESDLSNGILVRELCAEPTKKSDLVRALIEETGCSKSAAYQEIDKAAEEGLLQWNQKTRTYAAAPIQEEENA